MNEQREKYEITQQEPVGLQMTVTFEQSKRQLQNLQDFIREVMVQGVDYGNVEGIKKPFLFKSGAEKLAEIYGLAIMPPEVTHRVEDWEAGFFHYEVRITLTNKRTGMVIAAGLGSCNSKERKYRNQDVFSVVNTILKMGKKRALVDAVLSATRSSAIFTQDEDTVETTVTPVRQVATTNGNGSTAAKPATPAAKKTSDSTPEQKAAWKAAAQIRAFQKLNDEGEPIVNNLGYHTLNFDELGKFFKEAGLPGSVKDMSPVQLATAMDLLKDYPA